MNTTKNKSINDFTDLIVWQEGHRLVIEIYKSTKTFPREEIYGLTNQMRRAVVSVTSNVAEGFGRKSYKEKVQFYYVASASLVEVKNQLLIARDIKYLNNKQYEDLLEVATSTHKLLNKFISKTKSFIT